MCTNVLSNSLEDDFQDLVLSFHRVGPADGTQAVGSGGEQRLPAGPSHQLFILCFYSSGLCGLVLGPHVCAASTLQTCMCAHHSLHVLVRGQDSVPSSHHVGLKD